MHALWIIWDKRCPGEGGGRDAERQSQVRYVIFYIHSYVLSIYNTRLCPGWYRMYIRRVSRISFQDRVSTNYSDLFDILQSGQHEADLSFLSKRSNFSCRSVAHFSWRLHSLHVTQLSVTQKVIYMYFTFFFGLSYFNIKGLWGSKVSMHH